MTEKEDDISPERRVIRHIDRLVNNPVVPEFPEEFADDKTFVSLHDTLVGLRRHMASISRGILLNDVQERGFMAGMLKAHLANLRHLTWQVEQVSQGDFTQRVDFMGEFSKAFNSMVVQLDTTLSNLRMTELALTKLTASLRRRVERGDTTVQALKRSEARFKYLADHDPLTGTLNRRSFLLFAEKGMKAAAQAGTACSIALMDVDFFKKFNDTYGHLGGDIALKHVVAQAGMSLRQTDSMGRYGGEEFIFFFGDANLEQGRRAAERIRETIAHAPVCLDSGHADITVSMGISTVLPEWGGERDARFLRNVIARADAALYQAKQNGRNRVEAASLEPVDIAEEAPETDGEDERSAAP